MKKISKNGCNGIPLKYRPFFKERKDVMITIKNFRVLAQKIIHITFVFTSLIICHSSYFVIIYLEVREGGNKCGRLRIEKINQ